MKIKLLIGGVVALALVVTFLMTRPKEVAAPIENEQTATQNETATSSSEPVASTTAGDGTTASPSAAPVAKPTTGTTPKPQANLSLPYTATVVYTGTRFVPDEVVIIEGGTIRFYNQSTEKMWIASDNHPTHDRYPVKSETSCSGNSFDACASVSNGGAWTFAFTETGTWGFHNHVRAQDGGDVVVMTKEDYIKKYR